MKCPFCGNTDTQVIDSRVSEPGGAIRRRRRCISCTKRFTTYETVELRLPQVVKTNGTRSDFDVSKVRSGFQRALHKRPVPTELESEELGHLIADVLDAPGDDAALARVRAGVGALTKKFPVYG